LHHADHRGEVSERVGHPLSVTTAPHTRVGVIW
jgi:hypothetical protein